MSTKTNYNHTLRASYVGYITQAIVNSFLPLLFITLQTTYAISLDRITALVTINFSLQLLIDLISPRFIDRIGYRAAIVLAHICAVLGLVFLGVLPRIMPTPYSGLLTAIFFSSIGGGLIEVLISPIVEACPTEKKSAAMSLLHSFYCWGCVLVVLASTLFFLAFGIENWQVLSIIWALVPLLNAFCFLKVPIYHLVDKAEAPLTARQLLSGRLFWIFALLMVCAGACEHAMGQWASAFAESGLGVSKTVGDLAGPCMFAVLMGVSRAFYAKFSEKVDLVRFMLASGVLCIASYLLAVFSPLPLLSLLGCGLCGLSVGMLWPGAFSLASASCPRGGTVMFAYLALAGDLGCSTGPTLVGMVSAAAGGQLKAGLLAAVLFPALLLGGLLLCKKHANPVK